MSYRCLAVLGFLLLTAACGFQPLYSTRGDQAGARDEFAQIEIAVITGRLGQQVHNYLLDRISPLGRPTSPLYVLNINLNLSRQELGVQRDATTTRAKFILFANYRLVKKEGGEQLFQGSTQTANSFTIVQSDFANLSAEKDAIDRAAREVTDSIRARLALYFATQAGP